MSQGHGHDHAIAKGADRRYLTLALALFAAYMVVEVVVGLLSGSLAMLSDAGHMLTDSGAILLALVTMRIVNRPGRSGYTYGLRRAEIVSAAINALTLLVLTAYFVYEGIRRMFDPSEVEGIAVLITGVIGTGVVFGATRLMARANRRSLNVEGAYQHVLNDLYATGTMALSGLVVYTTGWARADAIAALIIAGLMLRAGSRLLRDSVRVFMEAAPPGLDPAEIGRRMAAVDRVIEVHDLHVWEVSSGYVALSAHVLVEPGADCHRVRLALEAFLNETYHIDHTTLQVDHAPPEVLSIASPQRSAPASEEYHCADPHGPTWSEPGQRG